MAQCTAHKRKTKEPCRAPAVRGKTVCRLHGGHSLSGVASGTFKDGRYSRDLPARLATQYMQARADTELLSTRDEIALVEVRLRELLAKLDAGDMGTLWPRLAEAKQAFRAAMAGKKVDDTQRALRQMEQLIDQGQQDWQLWQALGEQIDRLARLRTAEHKRLIDLQLVITQDQANVLLGALIAIVMDALKANISDEKHVRRIYSAISQGLAAHLGTTVTPQALPHSA